jgi:hypothetical protein
MVAILLALFETHEFLTQKNHKDRLVIGQARTSENSRKRRSLSVVPSLVAFFLLLALPDKGITGIVVSGNFEAHFDKVTLYFVPFRAKATPQVEILLINGSVKKSYDDVSMCYGWIHKLCF